MAGDDVERVEAVAEALLHRPALAILDHRMDIDIGKRHLVQVVEAHHHHAGDPQGDDLAGRHEHVGGVERRHVARRVGPAERGERPEGRREPRVEDIRVLDEAGRFQPALRFGVAVRHADVGEAALVLGHQADGHVGAVDLLLPDGGCARVGLGHARRVQKIALGRAFPDGDPVPPPQLPRDAPVALLAQPIEIRASVPVRVERDPAVADRLHGLLGQVGHRDEPLVRQVRLDGRLRAVAVADLGLVRLGAFKQVLGLEVLNNLLAGLVPVEAGVRAAVGVDVPVRRQDVDHLQVVPQAHLVVVRVVRGRDLDAPGAELRVDEQAVGDDRQLAPQQRQHHGLANEVFVPLVVGVDGDGGVAEHRLGPRGRHRDELAGGILDGVSDVPEVPVDRFVVHLVVGDGGLKVRVPVHQPQAAANQAVGEHAIEGGADGPRASFVQREAGAGPVARASDAFELFEDKVAATFAPGPDAFDEAVAADVVAGFALLLEHPPLNHRLGGDAGVVGAGQPEGLAALHAAPADEDVLKGVVQRVAQVKPVGHVRRRDDDSVRLARGVRARPEVAALLPRPVDAFLDGGGVVCLGKRLALGVAVR